MKMRYIRDWANGSDSNQYNHWNEIKALNSLGTNIAYGKPITTNGALFFQDVDPPEYKNNLIKFSTLKQGYSDIISVQYKSKRNILNFTTIPNSPDVINFHTLNLIPIKSMDKYFSNIFSCQKLCNSIIFSNIGTSVELKCTDVCFIGINNKFNTITLDKAIKGATYATDINIITDIVPRVEVNVKIPVVLLDKCINLNSSINTLCNFNFQNPNTNEISLLFGKTYFNKNIEIGNLTGKCLFTFVHDNHTYCFNIDNKANYIYSDEYYFEWKEDRINLADNYTFNNIDETINSGTLQSVTIDKSKFVGITAINLEVT